VISINDYKKVIKRIYKDEDAKSCISFVIAIVTTLIVIFTFISLLKGNFLFSVFFSIILIIGCILALFSFLTTFILFNNIINKLGE